MPPPFGIWIEGHQLQPFIFGTPRLRIMLGANAILGELWYLHLPKLFASKKGPWKPLPLELPEDADPFLDDPLLEDHPKSFFPKGIVTQAGGHFHGALTNEAGARAFATAAFQLIQSKAPGLPVDILVYPLGPDHFGRSESNRRTVHKRQAATLEDRPIDEYWIPTPRNPSIWVPWARPCDISGKETALQPDSSQTGGPDTRMGPTTRQKWELGFHFDNGRTGDPLGKLLQSLEENNQLSKIFPNDRAPSEFAELLKPGKENTSLPLGDLAVVKIDGNRYGDAFRTWREQNHSRGKPFSTGAYETEMFWYKARCLMRSALIGGIEGVLQDFNLSKMFASFPIRVLMLGGDDLLLVCPGELAIPLVIHFEASFRTKQTEPMEDPNHKFFSAGILIMPPQYPFYAAQELVEQLVDSAKARSRVIPGNWVDWHVLTTGHSDDLQAIRQRDYLRCQVFEDGTSEWLFLTRRPYPITAQSTAEKQETTSLKRLWGQPVIQDLLTLPEGDRWASQEPGDKKQARRKLKQMRASLRQGREIAAMDFQAYFENPSKLLGIPEGPWHAVPNPQNPPDGLSLWSTDLMDLLELSDLAVFWQWRFRAMQEEQGS